MLTFVWPGMAVTVSGAATEATQLQVLAELEDFHADNSSENSGLQSSLTSIDGKTPALVSGRVPVDGSGVTQPVSATNLDIRDLVFASDKVDASGSSVSVSNFPATQAVTQSTSPWVVDGSGVTQPVSAASLPLPTGASTSALQTTGNSSLSSIDGKIPANLTVTSTRLLTDGSGVTQPVSDAGGSLTVDGTVAATQSGTWTVQPGNTQNTTAWLVQDDKSSTATLANVSGSASSVTLQASNSARKGWMVHNDSSAILYVKFGSTASSTSYTVKLIADAYYELPTTSVYTGIITGIWASATGEARVTELT